MIQRRGFFAKLAGLFGLSALPARAKTCSEGPPINIADLLPYRPGTLRLGKARRNSDGSWTIPFEHVEGGWTLTGETTLWCKTGFELTRTTPGYKV
jgi:hypothetical protein